MMPPRKDDLAFTVTASPFKRDYRLRHIAHSKAVLSYAVYERDSINNLLPFSAHYKAKCFRCVKCAFGKLRGESIE